MALTQQIKTELSSAKQEFSVQRDCILKQFKSMHDALKIRLAEVEKGQRQRQNEELQDVSERLTILKQEIVEKDEQLSNQDEVISQLRTYIEQNQVGSKVFGTRSKVAGFIRKKFSLDKQSTSK